MSYQKNFFGSSKVTFILLISAILLGLFFRFANLSNKIFWVDEVATAVRVSGYTISEVTNSFLQQDIIERDNFLSYQTTDSGRTFADSMSALSKSPEHAPLYFILTRFWMQWWGNSIAVMRSLSVVFGLFVLPSLYWLCRELFARSDVGWFSLGIMSLSPFYVAYAQEARPYSLWTATILLTGASFIRAIRLNSKLSWLLYSLCLTLGLYTSLFSIYVAFFQGLYLLATINKQRLKVIGNFLLATTISLIAFLPWILVIINHLDLLHDNTSWMRGNFNLADIIAVYIGSNLLIFGDLPLSPDANPIQIAVILSIIAVSLPIGIRVYVRNRNKSLKFISLLLISSIIFLLTKYIYLDWTTIIGALVAIAILSISIYSLYYLIKQEDKKQWLYIICLMLSLPLPLLITDIINQGQSSTAPRYLIPLQLGILIAVAYTVANKLNSKKQRFWQFATVALIILGIYSNIRNLNLSPFYQKGRNVNNTAIAKIINDYNASESTLVIVESSEAMDLISLSYSLTPEVKYKVIDTEANITPYINKFDNVYLLKPTLELKQNLKEESPIELQHVYKSHVYSEDEFPLDLWRIK